MTRTLIIAAIAATAAFTAPVAAQQVSNAQAHFNQDFDNRDNTRRIIPSDSSVTVSTRNNTGLGRLFQAFNAQEDSVDGRRGSRGATVFNNRPSHGQGAFAAIRAESLEDE
ncbi:MAG: hypothetical protein AAF376_17900 [Pseudomonadota bacterium]